MRHTRAHTANRRSHHALTATSTTKCQDCGAERLPHRACGACGRYKGRIVSSIGDRIVKRAEKKAARAKSNDEGANPEAAPKA